MLHWCRDHTGTHVAILVNISANLVPKTGNVVDFTLFYVFLLAINTTFLCIYQEKCCVHFLSTLHHDGMVHSITIGCTMLPSSQTRLMQVQSLGHTGADPGFDQGGGPDRDWPKIAILGPQFCRILVLGPHFWLSGGGPPGSAPDT